MKVYLHIGSHKTGTTAIQDFAAANSDWLLAQGLAYPNLDLVQQKRARSHLGVVADLVNPQGSPQEVSALAFLRAARQSGIDHGTDLLFSAESLFRFSPGQTSRICSAFRGAFPSDEIIVVCGLRPQADFAESLYRNGFRAFVRRPEPFADWFGGGMGRFDYAAVISGYMGRLQAGYRLLPYASDSRGSFVQSFFSALGVSLSEAPMAVRQKNPSLDVVDCLAKLIVMGNSLDALRAKAFNNHIFSNPVSTDYAFLGAADAARLSDHVQAGNRVLLGLEPALESVLTPRATDRPGDGIDSRCIGLAQERAAGFLAERRKG